jgi:hypothetical protein
MHFCSSSCLLFINLNFTLFCQKKTTKQGAEKAQLHSRGPEGPDRSSLQADGTLFSASNKKQTILLEKAFVDERRNSLFDAKAKLNFYSSDPDGICKEASDEGSSIRFLVCVLLSLFIFTNHSW